MPRPGFDKAVENLGAVPWQGADAYCMYAEGACPLLFVVCTENFGNCTGLGLAVLGNPAGLLFLRPEGSAAAVLRN